MRSVLFVALAVVFLGCTSSPDKAFMEPGPRLPTYIPEADLKVEIHTPSGDLFLTNSETWIDIEGGASIFGGVRYLDLALVLDSSKSLRRTDPRDRRSAGAIGLVESLPASSDIQISVVDFDSNGKLVLPLTQDRAAVAQAIRGLNQLGRTNLAAGIRTALEEFERNARPDSTRAILLFTDGKSNDKKARRAMQEARDQGVAINTLLLGSDEQGAAILQELAAGTGASFVHVTDPRKLPEAFLNLRTTGVDRVTLRVNDSAPIPAHLVGGTFSGRVPLKQGENHIVAMATSLDQRTEESSIIITVGAPGCGELEVSATSGGQPALSISERAVAIVFDASNSMWGQMNGQPKISVAKKILQDAIDWFPDDLTLALRVYGHRSPRDMRDCSDSELLVPFGKANQQRVREAMSELRPRGQTPLAFSLSQLADDFGDFQGERAVVLVTDGIESCGGDPVAAARALREREIAVHVIGFGLGNAVDEDTASLAAIAQASGGRFFTASSAEELRDALAVTVGTPFRVFRGEDVVASGALGSGEPLLLPEGRYRVRLDSAPPQEVLVTLSREQRVTLTFERQAGSVSRSEQRYPTQYTPCEEAAPDPEPELPDEAPAPANQFSF